MSLSFLLLKTLVHALFLHFTKHKETEKKRKQIRSFCFKLLAYIPSSSTSQRKITVLLLSQVRFFFYSPYLNVNRLFVYLFYHFFLFLGNFFSVFVYLSLHVLLIKLSTSWMSKCFSQFVAFNVLILFFDLTVFLLWACECTCTF